MTQNQTRQDQAGQDQGRATGSGRRFGLVLLLALALVALAAATVFLPANVASIVMLAGLALLATFGVIALFAMAAGVTRITGAAGDEDDDEQDVAEIFFNALANGALISNRNGDPVAVNPAFMRLSGAESETGLRSVERLFSDNPDASEAVYRLANAAEQGRRASEEIRMPGGVGGESGSARWYRVRVNPVGSTHVSWLITDITREREHQENIFQELQNAIDYLDHAPAGFFSLEPDGRIRYINATLAEWIGIDLAEFEPGAAHVRNYVSVESHSLIKASLPANGEAATERLDIDLVRTDGTRLPVQLLHRVPVSPDGTIGASRTLVLSRTAGADAEAGRLAELRFSRFFNNTPMAIASVDNQGRLGITNARFSMLFGSGRQDGNARRLVDVAQASDQPGLAAAIDAAAAGQDNIPAVDVAFADDPERSARFFVSPIMEGDAENEAAVVHAMETTEQRALEAQFAQSQKMQAVGQLAGGIAHDFNNVLTAIIGFSDLLLTSHRPTDPAFQDIMNIKQNANRAAGLVRQLLAFSRRQTLRPKVIGLTDILSDLSVLLDRLLGEKVALVVEHGQDLWPIKADLNQLEQVIVNLAVNARDAMADGGALTIKTSNVSEADSSQFKQQGFKPGDYVMIEVDDTGSGMTPEIMEKIFEPFYSTKDVGKGTGLGLSTVYGIIKQTGGFIYVESAESEGTTFRMLFPRYIGDELAHDAGAEAAKPLPEDLTGNARILLVEDEEAVRAFAARALTARGYTVYEAATGTQALEVMSGLDEAGVDLVVSDVVMPEMDGPTMLRELRKTRPDMKIIFVSGYAEEAFAKHLPDDESFQFLPKPFSLKELATAVKQTLME